MGIQEVLVFAWLCFSVALYVRLVVLWIPPRRGRRVDAPPPRPSPPIEPSCAYCGNAIIPGSWDRSCRWCGAPITPIPGGRRDVKLPNDPSLGYAKKPPRAPLYHIVETPREDAEWCNELRGDDVVIVELCYKRVPVPRSRMPPPSPSNKVIRFERVSGLSDTIYR